MTKLTTLTAAAALVAAFGFTGTAMADTAAPDNVAADNINNASCGGGGDCSGSATDMLVTDGTFGTLGDEGSVTLNFTSNFCLTDGVSTADLDVAEIGGSAENYIVEAGTIGGGLAAATLAATGGGTDSLDIDALGITGFNQIRLKDGNSNIGLNTPFAGSDIDGALCLDSVDADVDDDIDNDGGGTGLEITFLTAYSDGSDIFVILNLNAAPVVGGKYRIHFDYTGDLASDGNAGCVTTSDDTSMRAVRPRNFKDTGPGSIAVDGSTLTYTVPYGDLGLVSTDPVEIWADVHSKGIQDRSPDTAEDGCLKPQGAGEVLQITLD